jgi:APA family basic amino acid/polyamine antiporter
LGRPSCCLAIIVTYDGWYSAIYFTEEDRDPGRNLPRSARGVCDLVIYLLVNLALLHVLTVSEIAGSTLPGRRRVGSFGAAAARSSRSVARPFSASCRLLLATRIVFAMSRDRLFFGAASEVNPGAPRLSPWCSPLRAACSS